MFAVPPSIYLSYHFHFFHRFYCQCSLWRDPLKCKCVFAGTSHQKIALPQNTTSLSANPWCLLSIVLQFLGRFLLCIVLHLQSIMVRWDYTGFLFCLRQANNGFARRCHRTGKGTWWRVCGIMLRS